jgi:hypothetical protein
MLSRISIVSRPVRQVLAPALTSSFSSSSPATYKTSTGLVGLKVDVNGRENLAQISAQVLSRVKVSVEHALLFSIAVEIIEHSSSAGYS